MKGTGSMYGNKHVLLSGRGKSIGTMYTGTSIGARLMEQFTYQIKNKCVSYKRVDG